VKIGGKLGTDWTGSDEAGDFPGPSRQTQQEQQMPLQGCSGCPGDYEDPDRTAGEEFEDLLAEVEGAWDEKQNAENRPEFLGGQ
jgi:hypothetical protein